MALFLPYEQRRRRISTIIFFFAKVIHTGEAEPKKTTWVADGGRRIPGPALPQPKSGEEAGGWNLAYFCPLRKGQAMHRERRVSCNQGCSDTQPIICIGKRKLTYLPKSET